MDAPSEPSSFRGNADGNLGQEGRQSWGLGPSPETGDETKAGQASMHLEGGPCEYGDSRSSQAGCSTSAPSCAPR
jgi:hypothetical protein